MNFPTTFRKLFCLGLLALGLTAAAQAAEVREVAGVRLEDRLAAPGGELLFNGAGLRTRLFFKVYVAALYLPRRVAAAEAVLGGADPVRMNLHLLRELDAATLNEALLDGLKPNLREGEAAGLQPFLDSLGALMRRIGKLKEGDLVSLDFLPDGLAVGLNGQARGIVAGGRQARRLLAIWLGEHPVDEKLKKALLGQ